jgi:hypothetical protein
MLGVACRFQPVVQAVYIVHPAVAESKDTLPSAAAAAAVPACRYTYFEGVMDVLVHKLGCVGPATLLSAAAIAPRVVPTLLSASTVDAALTTTAAAAAVPACRYTYFVGVMDVLVHKLGCVGPATLLSAADFCCCCPCLCRVYSGTPLHRL